MRFLSNLILLFILFLIFGCAASKKKAVLGSLHVPSLNFKKDEILDKGNFQINEEVLSDITTENNVGEKIKRLLFLESIL